MKKRLVYGEYLTAVFSSVHIFARMCFSIMRFDVQKNIFVVLFPSMSAYFLEMCRTYLFTLPNNGRGIFPGLALLKVFFMRL